MTHSRRVFIKNSTNVSVIWSLSAPLLGVLPLSVHAQADYPSRPIKIVVGFPAGGGTDVFARALAQALAPLLGQSVVVDNKAGAGGVIASTSMLQSSADGYTLLMGSTSTQAIAPQLYAKRPYAAAGQVPLMFDSIASAGAHIRAGKVKALGIAGALRAEALPGVPTIAESGGAFNGFDTPGWVALYAPKALPAPIVAKLQDAVAKVLALPDLAQRFAAAGAAPRYLNAADLSAYETREIAKWGEAILHSGAKLD